MHWRHPFVLFLLLLLPVLSYLFLYSAKKKKELIQLFGAESLQKKLWRGVHHGKRGLRAFLLAAGFALLVVALASPETESEVKVKQKVGSEFLIALDVSLSMLAQDESPNRLERAKEEILFLLERLKGYRVGLVLFAGTSFVQCPLTLDHEAIRFFLKSVDTESIPVPGSAFKKLVENAKKNFGDAKGTQKYLILFTDGEDLEGVDPLPAAREASRQGVALFCVGFGSPQGASIPLYEKGNLIGYKKDANETTVVTRLNEDLLGQLAYTARGRYFKSSQNFGEMDQLLGEVTRQGRNEVVDEVKKEYTGRFQIPLFLALLFLTAELAISEIGAGDASSI